MHSHSNLGARSVQGDSHSLPNYYPFAHAMATSTSQPPRQPTGTASILYGWRHALFSWFNILLFFVPASWATKLMSRPSHGLTFAFCLIALVPLVRLHDITVRELSNRIGGSRTGLLNGSLSNLVAVVVAISALQRCELRVVQSMLVGSILAKLLLVLGLCFFAGGIHFAEQGFDATATQVSSSLLSLSVGAVLLPAAHHFVLSNEPTDLESAYILKMSHGVAVILILIYVAYLVFQLWSHSHLYDDKHNKKSNRLSSIMMQEKQMRKKTKSPSMNLDMNRSTSEDSSNPPQPPYQSRHFPSASDVTLANQSAGTSEERFHPWNGSTVRLVQTESAGVPMSLNSSLSASSGFSSGSASTFPTRQEEFSSIDTEALTPRPQHKMSWLLTLSLLILVTGAVAATVELLVETMDEVSGTIGKEWVALILLPAISSVAEGMAAIRVSVKDELTLSVSVAVGSTIQMALLVIPFMVILAWITNKPLSLLMDPFQSMVLYIAVNTMGYVVADGKSNWLEGIILICLYVIIAVSFWFYPGSSLPSSLSTCTA